ncbi:unnamed protein product [Phytophthora fragariaefolia]|uniref:Unnamed protein product n=1 Tax=Phytophthora fragariaefolia TaxID=1490495 RepID=A0A9W6XG08_9STRA|nr:unnamed protein product [Phytophthora fragariaefolia]
MGNASHCDEHGAVHAVWMRAATELLGYAAEYAAYVLNRMPTRATAGSKSPIEIPTGKPADVVEVVAFGSPCKVYQNPKTNALSKRSTPGIILEKNEEMKGTNVLLSGSKVVTFTRYVRVTETVTQRGNAQLTQVLERETKTDLEDLARERQNRRGRGDHVSIRDGTPRGAEGVNDECTSGNSRTESHHPHQQSSVESAGDVKTGGIRPRRSERRRKKSRRQQEADAAQKDSRDSSDTAIEPQVRAPIVATTGTGRQTFVQLLALSVLGAEEGEYTALPDPKTYKEPLNKRASVGESTSGGDCFDRGEQDVGSCPQNQGHAPTSEQIGTQEKERQHQRHREIQGEAGHRRRPASTRPGLHPTLLSNC